MTLSTATTLATVPVPPLSDAALCRVLRVVARADARRRELMAPTPRLMALRLVSCQWSHAVLAILDPAVCTPRVPLFDDGLKWLLSGPSGGGNAAPSAFLRFVTMYCDAAAPWPACEPLEVLVSTPAPTGPRWLARFGALRRLDVSYETRDAVAGAAALVAAFAAAGAVDVLTLSLDTASAMAAASELEPGALAGTHVRLLECVGYGGGEWPEAWKTSTAFALVRRLDVACNTDEAVARAFWEAAQAAGNTRFELRGAWGQLYSCIDLPPQLEEEEGALLPAPPSEFDAPEFEAALARAPWFSDAGTSLLSDAADMDHTAGKTLLDVAVDAQNYAALAYLLARHGACAVADRPRARDYTTPLHRALYIDDVRAVAMLTAALATSPPGPRLRRALRARTWPNREAFSDHVLRHEIDAGQTPLHFVASPAALNALLEHVPRAHLPALLWARTNGGATPLMTCMQATPTGYDGPSTRLVMFRNYVERLGADAMRAYVRAADDAGRTALHGAAVDGDANAVIALVNAGADVNAQTVCAGETPMHACVSASHFGRRRDACRVLLSFGPDLVSVWNSAGHSVLEHACVRGSWALLCLLLGPGAGATSGASASTWLPAFGAPALHVVLGASRRVLKAHGGPAAWHVRTLAALRQLLAPGGAHAPDVRTLRDGRGRTLEQVARAHHYDEEVCALLRMP